MAVRWYLSGLVPRRLGPVSANFCVSPPALLCCDSSTSPPGRPAAPANQTAACGTTGRLRSSAAPRGNFRTSSATPMDSCSPSRSPITMLHASSSVRLLRSPGQWQNCRARLPPPLRQHSRPRPDVEWPRRHSTLPIASLSRAAERKGNKGHILGPPASKAGRPTRSLPARKPSPGTAHLTAARSWTAASTSCCTRRRKRR